MKNKLTGQERSKIIEDFPLLYKDHDEAILNKRLGI